MQNIELQVARTLKQTSIKKYIIFARADENNTVIDMKKLDYICKTEQFLDQNNSLS